MPVVVEDIVPSTLQATDKVLVRRGAGPLDHTMELVDPDDIGAVADGAITNAKLADMAANTIKANATAGTADPADLAVGTNTVVGRVAGNIVAAQVATGQIADNAVTFAKLQDGVANTVLARAAATDGDVAGVALTASQLLGRGATGDVAAITLGTNLSMSGTTLNASGDGGSGDVVGPASATDNAIARFDTTTGKLIQNSPVLLRDAGELTLPDVASPATPAADNVNLFGINVTGPMRLGFVAPDGRLHILQNDLGEFSISRWQPSVSLNSLVGENSLNLVALGTSTAANPAITNLHTMLPRLDVLVTTASTTAIAAVRPGAASGRPVRVGRDANAPGGFLARFLWGPATGVSNTSTRAFCGLDGTSNVPTDVQNSGLVTGIVGMGWDDTDTNIQVMHNDLSGAATKIDLGANFPVPTTDRTQVYELQMYSPNETTQSVMYRVIRYDTTAKTIAAEATGTITTNLPPVSSLLGAHIRMSVGGVSSVVGIAVMGILIGREY